MKNFFVSILLAFAIMVVALPNKSVAAGADTLTVYANGASLDEILSADVTQSGGQAHKVYKLVSVDTTYLYLGQMTISSDVTILGVPGKDGRIPCIQPGILLDGSMPEIGFIFNGEETKVAFKNIYFFGTAIDGSWNWGKQILITGDKIKLTMDNCVAEENRGEFIAYSGVWDKIYLTNSVIKNCVYPTDQWSTKVIGADYPTSNPVDTVVVKNCTIFNVNGPGASIGSSKISNYLEFSHNTFVYNFSSVVSAEPIGHVVINDNIFYGTWAGAITKNEYSWYFSNPGSADTASIISLDTLNAALDSLWDPTNYGNPDARMLAEAKRVVEVKNNVFYCPQSLKDFYQIWSSTEGAENALYVPSWMNQRTKKMFANKDAWPGFTESGNIVDVDPGFNSDVLAVVNQKGALESVESLTDYITAIRKGTAAGYVWGSKNQDVTSLENWVPKWPLTETVDLKYSNTALYTASTEGKHVGDPRWFAGSIAKEDEPNIAPKQFSLSEAYPNPFNPSTNIKFNISKTDNVSLKIYNVMGQLVETLINNEVRSAGEYTLRINMSKYSSGVYFYSLTQGSMQATKKMMLIK